MAHSFADAGSTLPDVDKMINNSVSVPVVESFSITQLEAEKTVYQNQIDAIQVRIDAAKLDLSIA